MMAQCTAHAQLKSVYGVSRVTFHREPGPPISMSKVRGPGVEANRPLIGASLSEPHCYHVYGGKSTVVDG